MLRQYWVRFGAVPMMVHQLVVSRKGQAVELLGSQKLALPSAETPTELASS